MAVIPFNGVADLNILTDFVSAHIHLRAGVRDGLQIFAGCGEKLSICFEVADEQKNRGLLAR
jgi:hypothetical protein